MQNTFNLIDLRLMLSKYSHYMLDIETTGLNPCSNQITSIAIVRFEPHTNQPPNNYFHSGVKSMAGRFHDAETMTWRKENKVDLMEENLTVLDIPTMLNAVSNFINGGFSDKPAIIWAMPKEFDIAYLAAYYNKFEIKIPWHYRNAMDVKTTLFALGYDIGTYPVIDTKDFQKHNALHDCLIQCATLQKGLSE